MRNCWKICKICYHEKGGNAVEQRCCVLRVAHTLGLHPEPHHHHNGFQFLFITKGGCHIRVGREYFDAMAGDLVVFSNLELHDVQPAVQPYERYHLLLSPDHLPEELGDRRLLGILLGAPRVSHLGGKEQVAAEIFADLLKEYEGNAPLREQWMACQVKRLLLLLYRCNIREGRDLLPEAATAASGLAWAVKEYLELHCREPVVLSQLAQRFFTSSSHLSHLFKRETGYNPKQYLQLCRLAAARNLLLESDSSVLEVSQKAGFSDINNFIRYFKRETGMTPGQYRRCGGHMPPQIPSPPPSLSPSPAGDSANQ